MTGQPKVPAKVPGWPDVQPGDIFATFGAGGVGWLVRHGSGSDYGHIGVIHDVIKPGEIVFADVLNNKQMPENGWYTAEAFPAMPPWKPGLRWRTRMPGSASAVFRVWRNEDERGRLLDKSRELTNAKLPYAWSEIAWIAAATVLPYKWLPKTDLTRAVICSNHVAQCIKAARPDDYDAVFRYQPHQIWPGGVVSDLQRMLWLDRIYADTDSGK